jgi:hypothetical protein
VRRGELVGQINGTKPMSVVLQSLETLKYVEPLTGWTERPELARKFGGGTDALIYCYQHRLKNMRILGQFDDSQKNFTINLTEDPVE